MLGRHYNSCELAVTKKLGVVLSNAENKKQNKKTGQLNRLNFCLLQIDTHFKG